MPTTTIPTLSQVRTDAQQIFPWPEEQEIIETTTPALRWLANDSNGPFEITLCHLDSKRSYTFHSDKHYHIVSEALPHGAYTWDVRCLSSHAERGVQTFSIAADARALVPPTAREILTQIPKQRPRHIFNTDNIPATRQKHTHDVDTLRRNITVAIADGLPKPPRFHCDENALPYREAFGRHRDFIDRNLVACALGHCLLNDHAAATYAHDCLIEVCNWNPEGPCSVQGKWGDEFGLSHCRCLPAVYDWCFDLFSDAERDFIERSLAQYARQMEERLNSINFALNPGHSHAGRLPAYLGEMALVLYGSNAVDTATCERWLDYALEIYTAIFPFYGGRAGGWAEGPFYASSYNKWYQPFFLALEQYCGYSFFEQQPFYRNLAHFFLHCGQPQWETRPFGDGYWCTAESPEWPGFCAQNPFGIFAERFGPDLAYTMSQQIQTDIFRLHLLDVFRPPTKIQAYKKADPISNSRLFKDTGYISMHADINTADTDIAVLALAGRYGPGSHRHSDQGNFAIIAGGKQLIGPSGYFGRQFGSDHHRFWTQQTQAHNCILINGHGQDRNNHLGCGHVLEFRDDTTTASCLIDLSAAYPQLHTYRRRILFNRQQMQVQIIDEIAADTVVETAWLLHSLSEPKQKDKRIQIKRGDFLLSLQLDCENATIPPVQITDQFATPLNQNQAPAHHVQHPSQYHMRWDFAPRRSLRIIAVMDIEQNHVSH